MSGGTYDVVGLDVSKWQVSTPNLAGQDFLIARATIGTEKDVRYDQHIANARKAGIVTGAYHFNWDTISVAAQVDAFLRAAGDVDLLALDVEGANAFSTAQAEEFIRRVQRTGRKIGYYHSLSGFRDVGQDWDWVAYWSANQPSRHWDIWQHGPVNGIDANRFNGTTAEFKAFAGKGANDMRYINAAGYDPRAGRKLNLAAGFDWKYLDGSPGGSIAAASTVYLFGRADTGSGDYVGLISTGVPYADKVARPTLVLIQTGSASFLSPVCPPTAPVPGVDTTPYSQADMDAATAAYNTLQAEHVALQTTASQLEQDLINASVQATEAEQERIALAEANRIRGI